jgi:hypothetical protein
MRRKPAFCKTDSELVRLFVERSGVKANDPSPEQALLELIERGRRKRLKGVEPQLQQLLKDRNVTSVEVVPDLGCDGFIEPIGRTFADGFRMRLQTSPSAPRIRFTMAHELCHTFFYELVPEIKFHPHQPDDAEERLCNLGAAALLIPTNSLRARTKKVAISLDSLAQLAREYSVSLPTMLLRLRTLGLWKCELSSWHPATSGDFVLDRLYGIRRAEWRWEDVSDLKRAWDSNQSIFGTGFLYLEGQEGSRRLKPVAYNLKRFGTSVFALWGRGVRPSSQAYPLLKSGAPSR